MGMRKSQVKYFDTHFSATIYNYSFKVHGRRYGSPTLLGLLEIKNEITDSVSMSFNENRELVLTFRVNDTLRTKILKGQFSEKGYYEIFLRYKKYEIPPGFPIIYGNNNINRIRMALTLEGDLIIDNMWDEAANIFLIGAGDKGRRQSFFKTKF